MEKDIDFYYRKLIHQAADTDNMAIYRQAIALSDLKYFHFDEVAFTQKAGELQKAIEVAGFPKKATAGEVIMTAKDITKTYNRNSFRLESINFELKRGEIFGLVGENGNGKTTLLRILSADLMQTSGEVDFAIPHTDAYDLRTKLIYIPQRTLKREGKIMDLLQFVAAHYGIPPENNRTEVLMMLARTGLWQYKDLKWSELSSGYKMRFELARTLLRKPDILLLDEPLANLDVLAQQVVLEDLRYIANSPSRPIGVVLSSQQLYEVERNSDRVIFLKNGKPFQFSDEKEADTLIVELESKANRTELEQLIAPLNPLHIKENGGVFVLSFPQEVSIYDLLATIAKEKFPFTGMRDISNSTRRFF